MIDRRHYVSFAGLALGVISPLACSPQVVDAVDAVPSTGGATMTGGSAGSGGSGVTGGSGGSGAGGVGGGSMCPDGGSEMDRDGDNTPDCSDVCPDDSLKQTSVGLCGCDFEDPPADGRPTCVDLVNLLAHRYAFNGYGTAVVDSVGGGAGAVMGGVELNGAGTVDLAGGASDEYVDLPNRIVSTLSTVTLEAFLRWRGGVDWQRIFDFGNNDGPGDGEQGPGGTSYLFLTPRTPNAPALDAPQASKLRLAYKRPGALEWEVTLDAEIAMPTGVALPTQVVVVIDSEAQQLSLYVDGELQNGVAYFRRPGTMDSTFTRMDGVYDWSSPVQGPDGTMIMPPALDLSVVDDVNNWLGRSQFVADAELAATYYEFRIYAGALSPELVDISHRAGPDATFIDD
jgi:hypothetical protein